MSNEFGNQPFNSETVIRVVGVGGAGGNTINRLIDSKLRGVEFVAINTDSKDLMRSDADVKISLSDETSRGLGAGANPERGMKAAQNHESDIEQALKGSDMVFITCGEGGGTGTGASPVVAHIAREQGALTIAIVTRPFKVEGRKRSETAEAGIEKLRKEVDAIIIVPNDRLLTLSHQAPISIMESFKAADAALMAGIEGITNLIYAPAYINTDFNDVKTILKDAGTALFGIGQARGEDRAVRATELAISSPLLEQTINGANGVIMNITGPTDLGLAELQEASAIVEKVIDPDGQLMLGLTYDESLGDDVRVTIIAAGFKSGPDDDFDAIDTAAAVDEITQGNHGESETLAGPQVPDISSANMPNIIPNATASFEVVDPSSLRVSAEDMHLKRAEGEAPLPEEIIVQKTTEVTSNGQREVISERIVEDVVPEGSGQATGGDDRHSSSETFRQVPPQYRSSYEEEVHEEEEPTRRMAVNKNAYENDAVPPVPEDFDNEEELEEDDTRDIDIPPFLR